MNDRPARLSRRFALKAFAALPALAAMTARIAEAKTSQAAVKYQNKPKGSQKCDNCRFFVAGKSASAMGTCQIVEGKISPNGWCVAWAKKA